MILCFGQNGFFIKSPILGVGVGPLPNGLFVALVNGDDAPS